MPDHAPLTHHDTCFGCGQANLFGLQLEMERTDGGGVEGRFFVKQDHQGEVGYAHRGVIAAALYEAISLLSPDSGHRLELEFDAVAPVGAFVRLEAAGSEARAYDDEGNVVATARVGS